MTPQLYINYKLKSVEHMPWKFMIYKFLNTIVDDLFAFVISMPWLKRVSVFRDGIIITYHPFNNLNRYYFLNLHLPKMDLQSRQDQRCN